jgi:hypothetical protein
VIKIYFLIFLFFSCDNPLINNEAQNCVLDLGGFIDDCGICSGGISNHIPNSDQDCNGQCFGLASKDGCGVCDIDETNNCTDDCNGDEGGAAFWDDCGNCVAGSTMNLENYLMDDCGQCYTTQSELDQQENNAMDLCGICSGNDTSCNYGLLTLSDLNFNQLKIWNNSTCSGNPYYIMDDYFCLDNNGACFSYSINFESDYNLGVFIFSQLIEFNNGNSTTLSGQWTLDGSGICLDYDDVEYEDGCYNKINFTYSYNDCLGDISLCEQNRISLTSIDQEQEFCSEEILTSEESIESLNQTSYPQYENFPLHVRNIFSYIKSQSDIK